MGSGLLREGSGGRCRGPLSSVLTQCTRLKANICASAAHGRHHERYKTFPSIEKGWAWMAVRSWHGVAGVGQRAPNKRRPPHALRLVVPGGPPTTCLRFHPSAHAAHPHWPRRAPSHAHQPSPKQLPMLAVEQWFLMQCLTCVSTPHPYTGKGRYATANATPTAPHSASQHAQHPQH